MKIILSRKGFDSSSGGCASPILPDGTLLSMPIPNDNGNRTYSSIYYEGKPYVDFIPSSKQVSFFNKKCHLDPDIRKDVVARHSDWKPAFGQSDAALSHLTRQGVGVGDIFLFFGWFRRTEWIDGMLRFKRDAPDQHIIYGYMQVREIIRSREEVPKWLEEHPHVNHPWKRNAIYIASDRLSLLPDLPGAGCLDYDVKRVLTKKGQPKRRVWALNEFFRDIPISYNKLAWHGSDFISAGRGQEFVFDANDKAIEWAKSIISD